MKNKTLYNFLIGKKKNIHGKYIYDIWKYSYEELENKHNFIQWLFPLKEKSFNNIFAPTFNNEFEITKEIKQNMLNSLSIMLSFYGFNFDGIKIQKADDFEERKNVYLKKNNHNYKRITRIIKSLKLFELENESNLVKETFINLYSEYSEEIGGNTLKYWNL